MEFVKKVNALILGLAVLLTVGCGSDDPEPENINTQIESQGKCLVTKATYPTDGPNRSGTEWFYDANKRLVRMNFFPYYELIEYDATGLVVTRKSYNAPDTSLVRYYISEYNQNGLLMKRTDFDRYGSSQTFESSTMIPEYNSANQLVKQSHYSESNKVIPFLFSNFTYLPNGSIKEEIYQDNNNTTVLYMTIFREFDNKNRPATSVTLKDGFGLGKGNMVHLTQIDAIASDTTVYNHSYQYNADNYPIQEIATVTGKWNSYTITLYDYNCQ